MIHEFHIEDLSEIQIQKHPAITKIVFRDCYTTTLVLVIPDGDILDALAHEIMMASLTAMDPKVGDPCHDIEF